MVSQQLALYLLLLFVSTFLAEHAKPAAWPKVQHVRKLPHIYRQANLPRPDRSDISGHIVGGTVATHGQFKYQVLLMIDANTLCGGALVSDKVVVTSARCVVDYTSFEAHLGAQLFYNTNEEGRQIITSNDVMVHEMYDQSSFNNDIAIIRLPTAAVTSEYVESINMADDTNGDFTGSVATISGWGTQVDGSFTLSNELRYNTVNIISNSECTEFYGSSIIIDSTICQNGADVVSPCLGDSGTGLVVTGEDGKPLLIGISSFISLTGQCEGTDPSGYMRISAFRDWILTNSP